MNTNEQTIHQMGLGISNLVKQATGRESVSSIDMDWVSVEQLARYIYGSGSGDVVSFDTNIPDAIESLIAYITAVQDLHGFDNPWPAGGGKNIGLLSDDIKGSNQNCTAVYSNNGVVVTASANYARIGYLIPVTEGTVYTCTYKGKGSYRIYYGTEDASWSSADTGYLGLQAMTETLTEYTFRFTAPSSGVFFFGVYVVTNTYDSENPQSMTIENFMVEKGMDATDFAPYENICPITGWTGCTVTNANMLDSSDPDYYADTYSFTFPDEAGTVYGGTLDVLSGVLTVTHEKVKVSDLSWTKYGDPVAVYYAKVTDKINNADNVLMSDTFKASENTAQNTTQAQNLLSDNMCIASKGAANPYIYCRADSINSAADFSSTYADAYFIYELAEPATYQLTAQEVTALIGQNNIFADTGNVSVQYKVKEDLV